jgi:hypothetical protein
LPATGNHGRYLFSCLLSYSPVFAYQGIRVVCVVQLLHAGIFIVYYCFGTLWLSYFSIEFQYFGDATHEQEFPVYSDIGFSGFGSGKFYYFAKP